MTVAIALVYPDLMGTYGDGGNATVLAQRLRWRGVAAEVVSVPAGASVPEGCEIYVIGGGEDLPQVLAANKLAAGRPLHRAVERGAAVLAVCAGLQILGESYVGPDGKRSDGLGLLGCVTARSGRPRAIGEVLVEASPEWAAYSLGLLSGFENHAGVTDLLAGTRPVGTVKVGVGNRDGTVEGAVSGRVWGTYLHGPVLARNPRLADLVLSWVVGELAPLDDSVPDALHAERVDHGALERRARRERAGGLAGRAKGRLVGKGAGPLAGGLAGRASGRLGREGQENGR
ncbi:MAG: type 1 glutamine amidotransferase [Acidimicrobiales bacterium]